MKIDCITCILGRYSMWKRGNVKVVKQNKAWRSKHTDTLESKALLSAIISLLCTFEVIGRRSCDFNLALKQAPK
jgi:hypothetical protein